MCQSFCHGRSPVTSITLKLENVNIKVKTLQGRTVDRYELQMARVKAGLRQYEIAQLLGVPATIICDLERGRRPVTDEWERRIREVLARRDSMDGNDAKHGHSNP